jgi:hypothetical protein
MTSMRRAVVAQALGLSLIGCAAPIAQTTSPPAATPPASIPPAPPAAAVAAKPAPPPVAKPAAPKLMTPADVDALTAALWQSAAVTAAPVSDDAEFLRRVSIDLIGRIPTLEEAERFLADKSPDKRVRLCDQLLASPEYAEHWADVSLDLFVGHEFRKPGLEKRLDPRAFYLASFRENRPYDRMAREMLTFSGEILPSGPGVFVASHVKGGGAETMASATARLFLGVQIQCAQCHDHPYDDRYKQEDFYGLAAFFARTKTKQEKIAPAPAAPAASASSAPAAPGAATLTATTAPSMMAAASAGDMGGGGDAGGMAGAAERADNKIYTVFDKPNGQMKFKKTGADKETVVQPRFFGRTVAPLAGEGRRDTLARAIVGSDLFAKTFVDRTWAQLFGRGIVEPWDDLGGENDPKHPPLLTRLADDFRASGYDIKHLLRLMVLSQAYGLTSRTLPAAASSSSPPAAPAKSDAPPPPDPTTSFARASVRRLTPEELFRSLIVATGVDRLEQLDADKVRKRIERALKEFSFIFADDEAAEVSTFNGNIPQALLLFNGELTNQGAKPKPGSNLSRILAASTDPAARLRAMFLSTYTRPPTDAEEAHLLPALKDQGGRAAYEDLYFALLTSTEMLTNH